MKFGEVSLLLVAISPLLASGWTTTSSTHHLHPHRRYTTPLFSTDIPDKTPPVRLEDRDVPIAHAGLHDALYGDGEAHGSDPTHGAGLTPTEVDAAFEEQTKMPPPPPPTLTEDRTLPVQILLRGLEASEAKVAAVYAVYSGSDRSTCEFVGLTRHLAVSLRAHVSNSEISKSCKMVRAVSFKYPQRSAMEEVKARWEGEAKDANAPSVNADTNLWATSQAAAASVGMTEEEKVEFENKKAKMRRAMADSSLVDEAEQADREAGGVGNEAEMRRRVELMRASGYLVSEDDDDDDDDDEGFSDDWSKAINAQTKETVTSAPSAQIESPFEEKAPTTSAPPPPTSTKDLAFTAENVDKVLEEIRPYLISDGGNVAVSHIDEDTRNVYLILQGACGSCPSSTTTMKMGIERVLKENFKNLGEVHQVDDPAHAVKKELTEEAVHEAVNALKPAINAMGGVVEVISVSDLGVVKLSFRGPNKIKYGLELAVLDVPMVKHIDFVD